MVAFAGFSTLASLASRVNLFVALCPIARVTHIRGSIRSLVPLADEMFVLLETLSTGELLPDSKVTKFLARDICGTSEFMDQVITITVTLIRDCKYCSQINRIDICEYSIYSYMYKYFVF